MPNVRILDATDLAALLPPQQGPVLLQAGLLKLSGDGVGGIEWSADAARLPGAAGKVPAGSAALLQGSVPRLLVDRAAFAARRGAASVALLATRLADPRSEVLTILGCNPTGRAVFEAVHAVFPHLERMLCFDPDVPAQANFADEIMTTFNVASIIPSEPREATEGAHILVTCMQPPLKAPPVEPEWLQGGTLCVLLDGESTFTTGTMKRADRRLTDDLSAWRAAVAAGRLAGVPEPEGDLAAFAAGRCAPRTGQPLIISVHFGAAAVDAALAAELLAHAEKAGRGRTLAL